MDDFGVKYVGEENAKHLIQAIKKGGYKLEVDWTGSRYCGITLDWNYNERTLVISMPGYVQKMLVRFKHDVPKTNQNSPYQPEPRKFGKNSDETLPADTTKKLDDKRKKVVQQVIGTCLFYARAVDCTILPAISSIASEQANATEGTEKQIKQLLDYLATLPNAKIKFYASKMILNVHSDASYLSEPRAKSRVAGVYFMGDVPEDGKPILLNGNIFIVCSMLKFVVASAAEAELGALFINGKETKII